MRWSVTRPTWSVGRPTWSWSRLPGRRRSEPILYSMAITGALVAIIPVIAFVLVLQPFWRLDLISGSLK